jgi:hypothetical protein
MSSTHDRIAKLLDQLANPASDRYDEGYAAGFNDATTKLLSELERRLRPQTVAPEQHPPNKPPTTRLTAPDKDEIVRQYLAEHPGARYRDMNRDLPPYVATRVYALEKRGEVNKQPDGGFRLANPIDVRYKQ